VKRTKLFRQPSGSDEGADAITLRGSNKLLWVGSIRSPAARRGLQPRQAIPLRNTLTISDRAITRVGKANGSRECVPDDGLGVPTIARE